MTRASIPRDRDDDHGAPAAAARREFLMEHGARALDHVGNFSFDPQTTKGNIENFIGAA